MTRTSALAALTAVAVTAVGCGGGGGSTSGGRHAPDLKAFLRLPVATPTVCGGKVSGTTVGRRSPWVGTVDVSVFISPSASPAQVQSLGDRLKALPAVRTVYFESAADAYAEFQRLYTCSGDVPPSAVPASYRLVLAKITRPVRDDLVAQIRKLTGVKSVSCDPSSPCLGQ